MDEIETVSLRIRIAPWWLHLLVLAVLLGTIILEYFLWNLEIFQANRFRPELWLNTHFILMCVMQFIRIVIIVICIGHFRLLDLGLECRLIAPALITLALIWIVAQTIRAALGVIIVGRVEFISSFPPAINNPFFASRIVGSVCEELLWRGFFMLQIYTIVRSWWNWTPLKAAFGVIVIVSVGFAFFHIPRLLMDGTPGLREVEFLGTSLLVGTALGIVFARTGNLLIAMGLHCFLNLPVQWVSDSDAIPLFLQWGTELAVMILTVHLIAQAFPGWMIGMYSPRNPGDRRR